MQLCKRILFITLCSLILQKLQSHLMAATEITLAYQGGLDVYHNRGDTIGRTIQFTQENNHELQVAKGPEDEPYITLYIDTKIKIQDYGIDQSTLQETHFLPWVSNHATFMQLDRSRFGNWFFTSPLSGCEVWIVHDRNGNQPFIIHLNLYDCDNKPEDMEMLGNEAVRRISETYPGYNILSKRIVKQKRRQFTYPDGTAFYEEQAIFYGRYTGANRCEDKSLHSGGWSFYLKDITKNKVFDLGE